jgi:hypothetical protein
MRKLWILFLLAIFLTGCASTREIRYGGYENDFSTGATFAHEYEMIFLGTSGERMSMYPSTEVGYLNERLDVFKCNLLIKNLKVPYRVWSYVKLYDICTNELFLEYKSRQYVSDKKLPKEKLLEVNLPFSFKWENVEVCFHIEVVSLNGGVLYKTDVVSYKVE